MPSFDIVCSPDPQEVRQAVANTMRNIGLRLDFRDTRAAARIERNVITITGDSPAQLADIEDVLLHKMTKRRVDTRFLDRSAVTPTADGGVEQAFTVQKSASAQELERIVAALQGAPAPLQLAVAGSRVHVRAESADALRAAMRLLREKLKDVPMAFANPAP